MDVATLGLATRYQDIEGANKALDKFSGAAGQAEKSARSMGTGATDAAHKTVAANDNVAKSASKLGGVYRKVAAIITGVFASAIAAVGLRQFISATVEADQVQAQLAAALRSTAGASGQTIDSLNKHAAALQKVTNFGDEAINSAQGILLSFTRIRGDQFDKTTEAVLNVATAMKTDLKSAAIQVGKALNDPIVGMTALSRSGITFTEAQKDMVKQMVESGNMIGAQTLILKELETQFGGSAKAARDVLGGALTSLRNAWGDLFEVGKSATEPLRLALEALITAIQNPAFVAFVQTIGTGMVQAFRLAVNGITLLVDGISLMVDNIDTIGVAAATAGSLMLVAFGPTLLAAVGSIITAVGVGLVGAFNALTAAMMRNPLVALVVAITAAITALYHFRDEVKQILGVDLIGYVLKGANAIVNSFEAAYRDVLFIWKVFPDVMEVVVLEAVNSVIRGVNDMVTTATAGIDQLIALLNKIPKVDITPIGGWSPLNEFDTSGVRARLSGNNAAHAASQQELMARDLFGAEDIAKGVAEGTKELGRTLDSGFGKVVNVGDKFRDSIGDTTSAVGSVKGSVDASAQGVTGAIGHQTGVLSTALDGISQAVSSVGQTFTSSLNLSVGGAEQSAIDKLARERDVISAGLQFKQLSPQDQQAAQLRLAEIDLQTAQLNQQMGEAKDALQSLVPMIFEMQTAGRSWAQITSVVSQEMRWMTGNTAIQPLSPIGGGFAGFFANGGTIPRGQFGLVGEKGPEFIKGPADIIPMQRPQAAVTNNNDNSSREVHAPISVTVMAPEGGGGSRESARELGRQVAQEAAYYLREQGII